MMDQLHIQGHPSVALGAAQYVLGSREDCDIVLPNPERTVSRQHAMLRRDGAGHWSIIDNASTNGTLVNGRRITGSCNLQNGDSIVIGGNALTLDAPRVAIYQAPPPVAPPQSQYQQCSVKPNEGRPLGIASVILGAITFGIQMMGGLCCGWIGWPLGIAALICGIIAIVQGESTLGIIGCVLSVVGVIVQVMIVIGIIGAASSAVARPGF
jgi:hypothetical protein